MHASGEEAMLLISLSRACSEQYTLIAPSYSIRLFLPFLRSLLLATTFSLSISARSLSFLLLLLRYLLFLISLFYSFLPLVSIQHASPPLPFISVVPFMRANVFSRAILSTCSRSWRYLLFYTWMCALLLFRCSPPALYNRRRRESEKNRTGQEEAE